MKVVLIIPPVLDRFGERLMPIGLDAIRECPSVGVYLLASVLRREGHDVVLADLVARESHDLAPFENDLDNCDLVGLGGTSMAWPTALDLIRRIQVRRPDLPVVSGGVHATLFDRHLVERHGITFVVRGEGETPIVALCRALEEELPLHGVPNLSWRDPDVGFFRNRLTAKMEPEEIASLPPPDYSEIQDQAYLGLGIESSRGCSFDCSFCGTPYRKGWRGIPAELVADRIEVVMEHTGRTRDGYIHITDDEFTLDPGRAIELARELRRRGLTPKLGYDSRAADLLRDGLVESLAEFTHGVLVGAECGYDEGLRRIGKGTTCRVLEQSAAMLQRNGVSGGAQYCFILGLPWETRHEVEATIRFAAHLHAGYGVHVILQWYAQIPGSRLWDEARRQQLVHEAMYDDFGFFRNLYLFRTGCELTPQEIWEVSEMALQLHAVSRIAGNDGPEIEYHVPPPIATSFPRDFLDAMDDGLRNLREIAGAGSGAHSVCPKEVPDV
jgi:radical SAM superfamily enzyme YgiQ (UPF0313 family)